MKEKSIAEDIFTRILKNKIYKYMISVSKYVYIDNLDDKVNKYNNIYHRTIKMKPVNINLSTYFDFNKNKWDPKFKIDDILGISKYKNIFAKAYTRNWSGEVLVIKKVKNIVPWTYVINDRNGEEIVGTFNKKELWKTNQKRVYKRKSNQEKRW